MVIKFDGLYARYVLNKEIRGKIYPAADWEEIPADTEFYTGAKSKSDPNLVSIITLGPKIQGTRFVELHELEAEGAASFIRLH